MALTQNGGDTNQSGRDRRERRRAKIALPVYVRAIDAEEAFSEVGKTIDVSRDGLLFRGRGKSYQIGQLLDITFPYSEGAGAQNVSQPAEVVRFVAQPDGKLAVAVRFLAAKKAGGQAEQIERRTNRSSYAAGAPEVQIKSEQRSSPPVILVIQPDQEIATTIRGLFEQQGYTVIGISTNREALEFLRENIPDVLIAKLESDDVPGYDLCVILKRDGRLACVPVILMARVARPSDYIESDHLKVPICVEQPFNPERLKRLVRLFAPPPASRAYDRRGRIDDSSLRSDVT